MFIYLITMMLANVCSDIKSYISCHLWCANSVLFCYMALSTEQQPAKIIEI